MTQTVEALSPDHVAWCRWLFDQIVDGGVWGVPRSGLLFRKEGDAIVLDELMPHDLQMPLTDGELLDYQREDFLSIRRHFEAAGITVRSRVQGV